MSTLVPEKVALVLVDMQNDFLHPEGAYGRGGQTSPLMQPLPDVLHRVAERVRATNGWVVSTQFTLITGKNGEPFISEHLKKLRPFLSKGDFESGSWGHDVLEQLKPVDMTIEKVAYSAFHQSRLHYSLQKAGVDTLVFGGIVTNGGVASTVREAHVLGYNVIVLEDGCAAFSEPVHQAAIGSLASIGTVISSQEFIERL